MCGGRNYTQLSTNQRANTNLNSRHYMRLWWLIVCKLVSMNFDFMWLRSGSRYLHTKIQLHVKYIICVYCDMDGATGDGGSRELCGLAR
jgi:hypothetical protein